jgi:hypothetical protein
VSAALIVLAITIYATAHFRPGVPAHVNFWKATSAPHVDGVSGDAPWALSALPGCFKQRSETTGKRAYVQAAMPPGMARVAPGTHLAFGDCTISVTDREVLVDRGSDHLRVPPDARLYRAGTTLVLLRMHGTTNELRIYDIVAADH